MAHFSFLRKVGNFFPADFGFIFLCPDLVLKLFIIIPCLMQVNIYVKLGLCANAMFQL